MDYPEWIIYYTDGSSVSSHDLAAAEAEYGQPLPANLLFKAVPPFGVQVIANVDDRVGYSPALGGDYYWYEYGDLPGSYKGWVAGDWNGAQQYALNNPRRAWILWGQVAANAAYAAIKAMLAADPRLPAKSGQRRSELPVSPNA